MSEQTTSKKATKKAASKKTVSKKVTAKAGAKVEAKAVAESTVVKAEKKSAAKPKAKASKKTKSRIKVTLVRSPIGCIGKHRLTVRGLGLRRMHQTVELEDTSAVRGMVNKVRYLVRVEAV